MYLAIEKNQSEFGNRKCIIAMSDENEFDGFSRLKTGEVHFSVSAKSENGNGKYDQTLFLYLPSRCAIVLKKID